MVGCHVRCALTSSTATAHERALQKMLQLSRKSAARAAASAGKAVEAATINRSSLDKRCLHLDLLQLLHINAKNAWTT